jgi:hypothetical protein
VITSGSYTASFPVAGSRIVACTKAPRFAELAVVQPDAAGDIPAGPVSCHGVARPAALSGSAGTMMSQLTLAAATGVVAVALGVALTVGQGAAVADAVVVGVAATVGVADAVAVGVATTVGVGVGRGLCLLWRNDSLVADTACVVPAAAVVDAAAVADDVADAAVEGAAVDGVAQAPAPCAERLRLPGPPISFRPSTRPTTSAMARGTAILAARAL